MVYLKFIDFKAEDDISNMMKKNNIFIFFVSFAVNNMKLCMFYYFKGKENLITKTELF